MRCVSYDADELQNNDNGRTAGSMAHCCILRRCIYPLVAVARDSEAAAWGHRIASHGQRTMEGATKQAGFTAPVTSTTRERHISRDQGTLPASQQRAGELGRGEHVWRSSRRTRSLAILGVHHDPAAAAAAAAAWALQL
jgi:hypothetical protein